MNMHYRFLPFEPVAIIPGRPQIPVIFHENDRSEDLVSDFNSTYRLHIPAPHLWCRFYFADITDLLLFTAKTIVNLQGSNAS